MSPQPDAPAPAPAPTAAERTRATASPTTPGPASSSSGAAPASPAPVAGLVVGAANDPAEHAADALADSVLTRLRRSTTLEDTTGPGAPAADADAHRHDPACGHLRRSVATAPAASAAPTVGLEGGTLEAGVTGRVSAARAQGRTLPSPVRRRMEEGFGTSLGHVRVHDGPEAARLSSSMQADAFTTGNDIFFGAGRFDPSSPAGEQVLAHELAHVVQETGSTAGGPVRRSPKSTLSNAGKRIKGWFTPKPKSQDELDKAEEERQKKLAVASSKKTEKAELAAGKERRRDNIEKREKIHRDVYGTGPQVPAPTGDAAKDEQAQVKAEIDHQAETAKKTREIQVKFDAALVAERAKFASLKEAEGNKPADARRSDEELADLAYIVVWDTADPDILPFRPPRETAAERLVLEVRGARTSEQSSANQYADALATSKRGTMLSKTVEGAYEVMVEKVHELRAADDTLSEADARTQARPTGVAYCAQQATLRKHKTPREMPVEGTDLDAAAWEQGAKRLTARGIVDQFNETEVERMQSLLPSNDRAEAEGMAKEGKGEPSTLDKGVDIADALVGGVGSGAEQVGSAEENVDKAKKGAQTAKDVASSPGSSIRNFFKFGSNKKKTDAEKEKAAAEEAEKEKNPAMMDRVTGGINEASSIFTSLLQSGRDAMTMAGHIKTAYKTKNPTEALKAAKSAGAALDGLVGGAKSSANLAKSITPSLTDSVKSVLPGFDIASSALAVVRTAMDVAVGSIRQHDTNTALFDSRARTNGSEADVLVWPMLKVASAHTKKLEGDVWTLSNNIADLVIGITQVATAGGFGVPAAVKAGRTTIDLLHRLGHFIADHVLATMAKSAEKASAVLHLEGAAQDELRRHPKMAVDAIIIRGAKGDQVAQTFLSKYIVAGQSVSPELLARIKPPKVEAFDPSAKLSDPTSLGQDRGSDDAVLAMVRDAVFADLGADADPQTIGDQIQAEMDRAKELAGTIVGVGGVREKWAETGRMAQTRNEHSGDEGFAHTARADRGYFWRLKMMLKGEKKFARSVNKTAVLTAKDDSVTEVAQQAKVASGEVLPSDVACAVGTKTLSLAPTQEAAMDFFDSLSIPELQAELKAEEARATPRNKQGWLELMQEVLETKLAALSTAAKTQKTKSDAATPAPQPGQSKQPVTV